MSKIFLLTFKYFWILSGFKAKYAQTYLTLKKLINLTNCRRDLTNFGCTLNKTFF